MSSLGSCNRNSVSNCKGILGRPPQIWRTTDLTDNPVKGYNIGDRRVPDRNRCAAWLIVYPSQTLNGFGHKGEGGQLEERTEDTRLEWQNYEKIKARGT